MGGVRLLTDPLLRRFVGPLRRLTAIPAEHIEQVDAVLISHLHGDHLDLPSLKMIGRETRLVVPKGAASYLKARHFRFVEEVEEGGSIDIGDVRVWATPAVHGGRQLPWVPIAEPLGFLIDGQAEIYFAGDTDIFPEMSMIGSRLEVALLPVWGWGPNLGKGHMDPLRAVRALRHLKPMFAIPIHWGTYCPIGLDLLRPRFLTEPPIKFARYAADLVPNVTVHILKPGQSFPLTTSD